MIQDVDDIRGMLDYEILAEVVQLRSALETMEAWMTHAISVMKDRRLVSTDQIEDGEAILGIARRALGAMSPGGD